MPPPDGPTSDVAPGTPSTPAIRLRSLTKVYPGSAAPAVDDLDLDVPRGEIVVLVGPSGCGKTTILKMINRLIEPTSGSVEINGEAVDRLPRHELRRGIGYVIQQAGLFPHRTVADNMGTVPALLGWDRARIRQRVDELADLLGLDRQLLDRYPSALSGGQQQRVGVARALAADPPVLLMDEPYSAVDPIVRSRLQDELLALQERVGKTIVLVTHDIDEAIKLGDRIALLNVGGRLEQLGPPGDLLAEPASDFVAGFLGEERALKRLALLTVGDISPSPGPVVSADSSPDEARRMMEKHHVDWVGVQGAGRIAGWVWGRDLDGVAEVGELPMNPFRSVITAGTSLRSALDVIVGSRTNVAVVVDDDDRYLGMVTVADISEGVREVER